MDIINLFKLKPRKDTMPCSLPVEWDNDWFHFARIHAQGITSKNNAALVGYIWVSGNWVEYHIFKSVEIARVLKHTGNMKEIPLCSHLIGGCFTVPELQGTWGFVFKKSVVSGICHRNEVKRSTNLNQTEFYSKKYGFVDTLYITHTEEAAGRWNSWHPDNTYNTVFSGATELDGFYFSEGQRIMTVVFELDSTSQPTGGGSIESVDGYIVG